MTVEEKALKIVYFLIGHPKLDLHIEYENAVEAQEVADRVIDIIVNGAPFRVNAETGNWLGVWGTKG